WVRMVQPHSGVGKGFYFIPEIGEEVLVGFEGGNAEKPYIIGAHYNGKQSSGYATADNSFKVIKTQTGHYLEFEELKGIKLADKKGNIFHIDSTADTLNIEALQTINLKAPNINLIATQNITSSAGLNITESAGMDHSTSAGAMMIQEAVADYSLTAANISEVAQGEKKSKAKEINENSSEHTANSEGKINVHAQKNIHKNSGEKTNFH
ncbi:MAG TPA: phage baseplate assembly protein V, partial [Flavobacterium sp.]